MKALFLIFAFSVLNAEAIILYCTYKDTEYGYACEAESISITSKSDRFLTETRGKHLEGKTDCDVKYFLTSATSHYLPQNLEVLFPNLDTIWINKANLKDITSEDLKPFGSRLVNFWLTNDYVEVLDGDLFDYTPNIEWAHFHYGSLRHVDKGIFSKLKKLKTLTFKWQPCLYEEIVTEKTPSGINSLISKLESKCQNAELARSRGQYRELRKEISLLKGTNSIGGAVDGLKSVKNTVFELFDNSTKLNECARSHVTTSTIDKIKSLIINFNYLKEEQSKMWTTARSEIIELIAILSTVCNGRQNSIDCGFIQTEVQRLNVFFTVPSGCLIF